MKIEKTYANKKIIAFDLDGTLAQSKMAIDKEMAELLTALLGKKIVAVIGGGSFSLFEEQFLFSLKSREDLLKNLILLPTSGACFCKFENGKWQIAYENILTPQEQKQILVGLTRVLGEIEYTTPKKMYGPMIEDRKTEITFSALGMKAPLEDKKEWNSKQDRRKEIKEALERYLPEFEIRLGGLTSLDITKKGIDKAYGVRQLMKLLSVSKNDIVYVGDALYEGGNDAAVLSTGVDTVQVSGPEETKDFVRSLLKTLKQ